MAHDIFQKEGAEYNIDIVIESEATISITRT